MECIISYIHVMKWFLFIKKMFDITSKNCFHSNIILTIWIPPFTCITKINCNKDPYHHVFLAVFQHIVNCVSAGFCDSYQVIILVVALQPWPCSFLPPLLESPWQFSSDEAWLLSGPPMEGVAPDPPLPLPPVQQGLYPLCLCHPFYRPWHSSAQLHSVFFPHLTKGKQIVHAHF